MANPQTRKPVQEYTAVKVLIMGLSVLGTLGGWGWLAIAQQTSAASKEAKLLSEEQMAPLAALRQVDALQVQSQSARQVQRVSLRQVKPLVPVHSAAGVARTKPAIKRDTGVVLHSVQNTVAQNMPTQALVRPRVMARTRSSR